MFVSLGATNEDTLNSTSDGSWGVRGQILLWFAMGAWNLKNALRNMARSPRWTDLKWLIVGYVSWAAVSIAWSSDPTLSARRLVEFLMILVGAVGIGAGYYGTKADGVALYCWHLMMCGVSAAVSIVIYVAATELTPASLLDTHWLPAIHPKAGEFNYAICCAIVPAVYLYSKRPRGLVLFSLPIVTALSILRFRAAPLFAVLVSVAIVLLVRKKHAAVMALGVLAVVMIYFQSSSGESSVLAQLGQLLPSFGQDSGTVQGLNGRVTLWESLLEYAGSHPLRGYGFGAFWNDSRMRDLWMLVGWAAPVGHNGYLDELLCTGAVGLALLLAFWLRAMQHSYKCLMAGSTAGALVFCCLQYTLLLNTTDSFFQAFFRLPFYAPLVALFALLAQRPDPAPTSRRSRLGLHMLSGYTHRQAPIAIYPRPDFSLHE